MTTFARALQSLSLSPGAVQALRSHDLVAVVGATGTGKSDFALDLADWLGAQGRAAEVVGADAMQLYRGMDIGTAKLPMSERRRIPHHLIDTFEVSDEVTVAAYQQLARTAVQQINERGATAILVGGSGLYVSSVIYDFRFPARDTEVRARLEAELDTQGAGQLYRRLLHVDPKAAEAIGATNGRRIVRALETIEVTGTAVSGTLPDEPQLWRPSTIFGLQVPRPELVDRLDRRVEAMWDKGMLAEVTGLVSSGVELGVTARRAIGYAQALQQLDGSLTQAEAIEQTQSLTRRYARRQVSWFKRYPSVHWVEA